MYDCEPYVRAGFLRKVYGVLTLQLLTTVGGVALFTLQPQVREWALHATGAFHVALVALLAVLIALMCLQHRYPA